MILTSTKERISLTVFVLRELFELRGARLDQVIQGSLCSVQVHKLSPQGASLLSPIGPASKYISHSEKKKKRGFSRKENLTPFVENKIRKILDVLNPVTVKLKGLGYNFVKTYIKNRTSKQIFIWLIKFHCKTTLLQPHLWKKRKFLCYICRFFSVQYIYFFQFCYWLCQSISSVPHLQYRMCWTVKYTQISNEIFVFILLFWTYFTIKVISLVIRNVAL